ncbi:replication initiation protein [Aquicella lusitana]|uniref:Replication initiator protein n=1 Tax=Aquicella lusitana TaxID=254246 RepID=A0A370G935_9COXI|nr:replication initiation protein [Aquicella lusitana]RDI38523.1 replication initiator protein [Aquicella lusitana]VVC74539.1 hypothetical protein AQULUS_23050 [Aquicella lusitana]
MDSKKKRTREKTEDRKDSSLILKKHVGLIHCENKLTLIQRKICNILLFNALDKINDQDIYEIPLRKLCSLVGYNSNDIKLIKESIKSLIAVVMEWNLLEDRKFLNEEDYPEDAITWNASSLLAGASIKNGIIRYSYSPQMKSILSSLDIYGRINLFVQAKFNSTYSLVLYENCVRFKNLQQTSWFPLYLFRSLMGVTQDKYRSFKEFKRNVINVAVNEINQKADIYIEPQYKKSGRNITAIQFLLSENQKYKPAFKKISRQEKVGDYPRQRSSIIEILMAEFNFSEKQANEMAAAYAYEYLIEKIQMVRAKQTNVQQPAAYLIAALKKDYKNQTGHKLSSNNKTNEQPYQRVAQSASEISSLRNKYMTYRLNMYIKFVQQQAENIQKSIQEKFELSLKPKLEIFKFYKRKGLTSPFVMSDFMSFIDEHYPQIVNEYLDFEEYITADEVEA